MDTIDYISVSRMISGLKDGDEAAAAGIWERYFQRLIALARKQLGTFPTRAADEEDVAVSVFESLCKGAAAGRFEQLSDRDDLWRLLAVITCQKSADLMRREGRQKRGGGKVRGESVFTTAADSESAGLAHAAIVDVTPDSLVAFQDCFNTVMQRLEGTDAYDVAMLRMQGASNEEIATHLEMSISSVERKLRLIRAKWLQVLE